MDRRGALILRAARADGLLGRGESPLKVEQLSERGQFGLRWESTDEGPDLDAASIPRLVVDESAGGEDGIVQMRGNVDPAHENSNESDFCTIKP